jgi:hypothetical protein
MGGDVMESKVIGGFFIIFSILVMFVGIPNYVVKTHYNSIIGPELIPMTASLIILISSIGILIVGKSNFTGENAPSEYIWKTIKGHLPRLLMILAACVGFSLLISSVGLLIAVIFGVNLVYFAFKEKRIRQYVMGTLVVFTLGIMMKYGLGLFLPIWSFNIWG